MGLDFESKFYLVWIVSSVIIGLGGTILYKIIQDIKEKKVSMIKYVLVFLGSTVLGLAFEWGLLYLAL